MVTLAGKVALVTGAARGIGRGIAEVFAEAGADVAINDIDGGPAAAAVAESVRARGRRAVAVAADVARREQVEPMFEQVWSALGPIDILVNNAGITRDGTMHRMDPESWRAVIDTNLGSCFNMSRCVIESMRDRGFGRIVNIGSINGQAGQYGQVNYAAAKSGIHGFTKALAQEGASAGITVNAIAPGYVDTDMVRAVPKDVLEKIVARIPMRRLGKADDIARGVLFLVADDAVDRARSALDGAGLGVADEREVLVVDIKDRPGTLGETARELAEAGVNIELLYTTFGGVKLVLATDDLDSARAALA